MDIILDKKIWGNLPDDLVWKIRGCRSKIKIEENADIHMTTYYRCCFGCGCCTIDPVEMHHDDIFYNFCSKCANLIDKTDVIMFLELCRENPRRWKSMYHGVISPNSEGYIWDLFWRDEYRMMTITSLYNRFDCWSDCVVSGVVSRYSDNNGNTINWGYSDDEVDS